LDFDLEASVSPKSLPKGKPTPVRFEIAGGIEQGPSVALREATAVVDKDVDVSVEGLPLCDFGGPRHPIRRPDELRQLETRCGDAIVGRGRVGFSIAFPGLEPVFVASRVALFNATTKGAIRLIAVAETRVPVPSLLAASVEIRKAGRGWTARVKVPVIAGGSGAITHFTLNMGRKFTYRGERRSFLSARCPDGVFKLNLPKLIFRNEARIPGVGAQTVLKGGFAVPCKPRR
jgi:hypothetical protein